VLPLLLTELSNLVQVFPFVLFRLLEELEELVVSLVQALKGFVPEFCRFVWRVILSPFQNLGNQHSCVTPTAYVNQASFKLLTQFKLVRKA